MTKTIAFGLVLGCFAFAGTALAAGFSAKFPRAAVIGVVESGATQYGVYKLTDGTVSCYVVPGNVPSISCVK